VNRIGNLQKTYRNGALVQQAISLPHSNWSDLGFGCRNTNYAAKIPRNGTVRTGERYSDLSARCRLGCLRCLLRRSISRLLKNAHRLRCPHPSSLRRTSKYASFLRIAGALHLAFLSSLRKMSFSATVRLRSRTRDQTNECCCTAHHLDDQTQQNNP